MVLSNEPGFYQDGEFGIRIENLVKIVPANPENNFKDRKFCTFENLTFVPIQKKMYKFNLSDKFMRTFLTEQFCLTGSLLKC